MSRKAHSRQAIVLGLDGGGTKSVCVAVYADSTLVDSAGTANVEPLARIVVGSTNWNSVGVDTAKANLREAFNGVIVESGHTMDDVLAACLGLSGVDRPEDRERVDGWLAELLPGVQSVAQNDAIIALASGTGGHLFGIVLISGTGMISMGYNRKGKRCRAGGWGALLGDGGSGYAIGSAALRAVTWAADDRAPKTVLTDLLLKQLELQRVEQLVRWTYDDISWQRIAKLAPLVTVAYEAGDAAAIQIVRTATTDLALAAESVARCLKLESDAFPLVFVGGGLQHGVLASRLQDRFQRTLPNANIIHPTVEPAVGAALLALQTIRT